MDSDIPIQIAETVQTAHIKRDPSPSHDINPSTAASKREPASVQTQHHDYLIDDGGIDEDDDEDEYAQSKTETDEESDYNVVKSRPRRNIHQLPPIPDLRYEQSYLHSIRNADRWWKVVLITARDQACFFFFSAGYLENLHDYMSTNTNPLPKQTGHDAPSPRSPLQHAGLRMAVLESKRPDPRLLNRSPGTALVVRGQQLGDSPCSRSILSFC
ncbi:hypothetical protein SMACR_08846 [Sordaria macrospora]|uniref:Uncharacterized protein n=1 Tax=Sordaria macrospora TaxID=5147 RepID=A0A8S9A166_SORMA|nr:hypothetical protein SMACR_08846 [Sordaria macrospora]WPJ63082.1 hypothetical protein SMAC4_08846 [Sordaria macrospora]